MTLRFLAALVAVCLGANTPANALTSASEDTVRNHDKAVCELPEGWNEVNVQNPDFLILGELHGSEQGPEFAEQIICALASEDQSVLLAVEFRSQFDPVWQEAWSLTPQDFANAIVDHGWRGRNDGVASEAMWRLVMTAHWLIHSGADVDIVAFNGARDDEQRARFKGLPGQGPHEAAQAENIAQAADRKEYDHVLVLVGSFHAKLRPARGFEPMAMKLQRYGSVTSLAMVSSGGSAWNCQLSPDANFVPGEPIPDSAVECAAHLVGGAADLGHEPIMAIGSIPGRDANEDYHGYFSVGPVTASPPAAP